VAWFKPCNTRTVFSQAGLKTAAIRVRGLGFEKMLWFNQT
jgi:hypothetical protein